MKRLSISLLSLFFLIICFQVNASGLPSGGDEEASVKLVYAEGKIFYDEVYVNWETEYEMNPCEFIVEKSRDGDQWQLCKRLKSNGAPDKHAEYQFVGERNDEYKFYRIRKLDRKGNVVLKTLNPANYSISVEITQVSVANHDKLVLEYKIDRDQKLLIRIYDKLGRQVETKAMPFERAGEFMYHLNVDHLEKGNYLLVVTQTLLDRVVAEKKFSLSK